MKAIQKLSALVQERGLEGDYSDLGAIYTKLSPEKDLILFNYSPLAMVENTWNGYEQICRGLALNSKGEIVALPFKKFFNFGQMGYDADYINRVGIEYLTEKMDGSLGILYYYNDQWNIITRGSFDSDQSKKAYELLAKYDLSKLMTDATYLLEIIYPENRVVLSYNREFLCLLAVIDNKNGYEYDFAMCQITAEETGFDLPQLYPPVPLPELIRMQSEVMGGMEGWVATLNNGERVKFKTQEYLALHRAANNISFKNILNLMYDQKPDDIIALFPDEFRLEVTAMVEDIQLRVQVLSNAAQCAFKGLYNPDRRTFALSIKDLPGKRLLFLLYDNRDIREACLDMVKDGI